MTFRDDDETPNFQGSGKPFWLALRETLWAASWVPWLRLMGTIAILVAAYVVIRAYGG